jgi:hypothetical protein
VVPFSSLACQLAMGERSDGVSILFFFSLRKEGKPWPSLVFSSLLNV